MQQQWDLLNEKLRRLNREKTLENREAEKLRLETQVEEAKTERDRVEQELKSLEDLLSKDDSDANEVFDQNDDQSLEVNKWLSALDRFKKQGQINDKCYKEILSVILSEKNESLKKIERDKLIQKLVARSNKLYLNSIMTDAEVTEIKLQDTRITSVHQILVAIRWGLDVILEKEGIRFLLIPPGIAPNNITNDAYFYLAETPLSEQQWANIMDDPKSSTDSELAKVNISRSDIYQFLDKLNRKKMATCVTSRPFIYTNGSFDVFLSHNSQDKPTVRQLAQKLQVRGLQVWLDEEQLVPGRPWQEALETIIKTTRTAAVLIGKDGLGPWEIPEVRACLSQFVKRCLPVIPVLLPDAPAQPELPPFLHELTWVDLRGGLTENDLDRLEWGITGVKPGQSFGNTEDKLYPMATCKIIIPDSRQWRFANACGGITGPESALDEPSLKTTTSSALRLHDLTGVVWQLCRSDGHYVMHGSSYRRLSNCNTCVLNSGTELKQSDWGFRPALTFI